METTKKSCLFTLQNTYYDKIFLNNQISNFYNLDTVQIDGYKKDLKKVLNKEKRALAFLATL